VLRIACDYLTLIGEPMLTWMPAIFALLLCAFPQIAKAQNSAPASEARLDRLIVYGDGFVFGVKEPDHWRADTGEVARKYHVNVIFVSAQGNGKSESVNIRVRVNKKVDENTIEDLDYDMEQYKKEYPKAEFGDLLINHPEYETFAKLVYVPNQFYEYVAYINPGAISKFTFSVAMSKNSNSATPEEMKAFESVLNSLVWLSSGTGQR
jgi:hypothetical protein